MSPLPLSNTSHAQCHPNPRRTLNYSWSYPIQKYHTDCMHAKLAGQQSPPRMCFTIDIWDVTCHKGNVPTLRKYITTVTPQSLETAYTKNCSSMAFKRLSQYLAHQVQYPRPQAHFLSSCTSWERAWIQSWRYRRWRLRFTTVKYWRWVRRTDTQVCSTLLLLEWCNYLQSNGQQTSLLLLEWCNYLQSNGQHTSGKKAHSIRTVAIARVVLLLCRERAAV